MDNMTWNNSVSVYDLYDKILKNWWPVSINSNQSSMWGSQFVSDYNDTWYFDNRINQQDKRINELQWQANSYLTGNSSTDSIITTPQTQRSYEQQTIAQMNPDLKKLNAWYLDSIAKIQNLQNEKVSLAEAKQMMQDAYQKAIDSTNKSANWMMAANMANANIQAGWAISSSRWLSTNPAAAAATRMSAQNQAAIQNATIRSQADQNLANVYGSMANMPSVLSSIATNNTNADIARLQAEWQALSNYKDLTTQNSSWWYSYSWWGSSGWGSSGWSSSKWGNPGWDDYKSIFNLDYYKSLNDKEKSNLFKWFCYYWQQLWLDYAVKIYNMNPGPEREKMFAQLVTDLAKAEKEWKIKYDSEKDSYYVSNWKDDNKNSKEDKSKEDKSKEDKNKNKNTTKLTDEQKDQLKNLGNGIWSLITSPFTTSK